MVGATWAVPVALVSAAPADYCADGGEFCVCNGGSCYGYELLRFGVVDGDHGTCVSDLGDLDQLENLLKGTVNPGALAEVDIERARELVGDDMANSMERMAELSKMLQDAGLIDNVEGRLELTPEGLQ